MINLSRNVADDSTRLVDNNDDNGVLVIVVAPVTKLPKARVTSSSFHDHDLKLSLMGKEELDLWG